MCITGRKESLKALEIPMEHLLSGIIILPGQPTPTGSMYIIHVHNESMYIHVHVQVYNVHEAVVHFCVCVI